MSTLERNRFHFCEFFPINLDENTFIKSNSNCFEMLASRIYSVLKYFIEQGLQCY